MSKRKKEDDHQTKTKQRKFNEEQSLNKSQTQFSLNEKRCFLKACQENGLNVIYNIDKLKEYLPERNETEINFLIKSFERKSKYRREDNDKLEDNDSSNDTPLELWYKLCESLVRPHIKKDDYSYLLTDLVKSYSEKNTKYSDVYRFIKELMEGRYPSKLDLENSIIFLSLINNLKNFIENQDLSNEKDYLLNKFMQLTDHVKLSKENQQNRMPECDSLELLNYFERTDAAQLKCDIRKATAELNNEKIVNYTDKELNKDNLNEIIKSNNSTIQTTIQQSVQQTTQQTAQQTSQTILTDSSSSSPSSINSNLNDNSTSKASKVLNKEDNPFYYYSQMPRIRLIKESLNPLDISIETIRDLHSYVTLDRLVNEANN